MISSTVYQSWKIKLYPYGWHLTQPPQEGSNRNLALRDFLSCHSYVSCQVQLKIVPLILCDPIVYYINICFLMLSHVEPCQNYGFTWI